MPSGGSRINSANAFANYTGLTTSDERERERENFICKEGTPERQLPIYTGTYVTVHNNAHNEKKTSKKQTTCI